MEKVTLSEIRNALSEKNVRIFQAIYAAIGIGITAFMVIVLYLYIISQAGETTTGSIETMHLFTIVHGVMFLAAIPLSKFFYNFSLSEKRVRSTLNWQKGTDTTSGTAENYLMVLRSAKVLRLAILEGPGFFGLVVLFMGTGNGALKTHPYLWVNIASYLMVLSVIIRDFPAREKLLETIKEKMGYLITW